MTAKSFDSPEEMLASMAKDMPYQLESIGLMLHVEVTNTTKTYQLKAIPSKVLLSSLVVSRSATRRDIETMVLFWVIDFLTTNIFNIQALDGVHARVGELQ